MNGRIGIGGNMARAYLGKNEKNILNGLKKYGPNCPRKQLIYYVRMDTDTSKASLYWTIKNMQEKGLIIYDPFTDTINIPDHWLEQLRQTGNHIDICPQHLLSVSKRIDIFKIALKNISMNETELFGLYGLLDLNIDSLKKLKSLVDNEKVRKGVEKEKGFKEASQLLQAYKEI